VRNPNIVVISDYGTGDPAFTEVILRLKHFIPNSYIVPQSTPPFSTLNTGFWIYQIALNPESKNTYIFSNVAPRKEDKNAQKNNTGEKLMYAKLKNGFEVMAVNSTYAFSFIKPYIDNFCFVDVANGGSQFRSRDFYPKMVAQMVTKDKSFLAGIGNINTIPDVPENTIASIDGYGNIKTTTRLSQVKLTSGQIITIKINKQKHPATHTDGVFHVKEGELAFAPGSSGHNDKFMEIFVRGGSAYRLFDNPEAEEEFSVLEK